MPLTADTDADVCVIGAGMAGLCTAYLLARAGRRVVVLDMAGMAAGETGRTTAHLASAQDDRFTLLEKLHGEDGARLVAASHAAAIDLFERISRDEQINCDFTRVDGWLFPGPDAEPQKLDDELTAARRAGLDVARAEPPFDPFQRGLPLCFRNQARFHPLRFLSGIAHGLQRAECRIHTHTRVSEVAGGDSVRVHTAGGHTVRAGACVVASGTPFTDRVGSHVRQAPYRTYVIAARVPAGSVPDALYWDDGEPYVYIRLHPVRGGSDEHDLLIVGGEDSKTGQHDDGSARLARLAEWTRARFPVVESIEYRWSGQVFEPNDSLGMIGRHPGDMDNVYLHSGDSGQGITHAGLGALLLTDLILGRDNLWSELYDPSRVTLRAGAAREFARENLNVAVQYAAWARPGEVPEVSEIAPGCGRIVRRGTKLVAAYRDDGGVLHERSAACPHMGCVVAWNSLERSWDCPCHGSRFHATGELRAGPAARGLSSIESDDPADDASAGEDVTERDAASERAAEESAAGEDAPAHHDVAAERTAAEETSGPLARSRDRR